MGREGRGGKGGEHRGAGHGRGGEGKGLEGRAPPPNILLHPQFQFSRNMPAGNLHWLPVRVRIEFKLAVLMFRCLHGTAPPYIVNELCRVADIDARRRLRSASTSALVTPSSRRSTIGDRAFFVAVPRVWNSFHPASLRHRHSAPSGAG